MNPFQTLPTIRYNQSRKKKRKKKQPKKMKKDEIENNRIIEKETSRKRTILFEE